jgi:drug/metabolite transporter (DMT)-like permease
MYCFSKPWSKPNLRLTQEAAMIRTGRHLALGVFWALFAILIWSGSLVLLKLGVTTHLNAYDLTALRIGAAGALLLPVVVKRGMALNRLGATGLVVLIGSFGALYIVLLSQALKTASASAAGALNPGIMAVSAMLFGIVLFKDRARSVHVVGITLILFGLCAEVFWGASKLTIGHLILVLTGAMWATYAVIIRRTGIAALHATALVAVGSAAIYLPIYAFALPKQVHAAPLPDILVQTGFQGVLVSILAVYAFTRSAELLGPVVGSTLPALIPLVALLQGAFFLGEPFQTKELTVALTIGAGVALILAGRQSRSEAA